MLGVPRPPQRSVHQLPHQHGGGRPQLLERPARGHRLKRHLQVVGQIHQLLHQRLAQHVRATLMLGQENPVPRQIVAAVADQRQRHRPQHIHRRPGPVARHANRLERLRDVARQDEPDQVRLRWEKIRQPALRIPIMPGHLIDPGPVYPRRQDEIGCALQNVTTDLLVPFLLRGLGHVAIIRQLLRGNI